MRYEEMSESEKRLARSAVCPLCKHKIEKIEDIQLVKVRHGRAVIPFYMHTSCLLSSLLSSQLEEPMRKEILDAKF